MAFDVLGKRIELKIAEADLDCEITKEAAKNEARRINPQAMLLSWHSSLTGQFFPNIACGHPDRPPWVVWAASRGANLTVTVNEGACVFYFLI